MMAWRSTGLSTLAALSMMVSGEAIAASPVDGTWLIRDLMLDIFDCQSQLCGRVAWLKDPGRRPSQCGKVIVWGLAADGKAHWTGGSIRDLDDGSTYRLSATLQPDGSLHARIYLGTPLLGQTEILQRVSTRLPEDRCPR
jgi:uncharacterized protein (DUF2147 family)